MALAKSPEEAISLKINDAMGVDCLCASGSVARFWWIGGYPDRTMTVAEGS